MSAPRDAFAAVWAVVWVRWRLLAVRLRGLLAGGRDAAAAGSGYYLSSAEIPVEGVDYESLDLPPELAARLEAARVELVDRARATTARQARRRRVRRRRTASLAMAALLTLAVLGAGATALVGGSTGVPAIDRLLGTYEAGLEKPGTEGRRGPSGRDVQPRSSGASTLIVPLDGSRRIAVSAYVADDGNLCLAMSELDGRQSGDVACSPRGLIAEKLSERAAFAMYATRIDEQVLVRGFTHSRVTSLNGTGPSGGLTVHLGQKWVPGVEKLKPFVAVGDAEATPRFTDPSDFVFRAR